MIGAQHRQAEFYFSLSSQPPISHRKTARDNNRKNSRPLIMFTTIVECIISEDP